jgi:hypothetical protein
MSSRSWRPTSRTGSSAIAPPYDRNWHFFKLLRSSALLAHSALVLTTTHKQHLDTLAGTETGAIEVVGKS